MKVVWLVEDLYVNTFPLPTLSLTSVGQIRENLVLAVNREFVGGEERVLLREGDQVAVIPPISGG